MTINVNTGIFAYSIYTKIKYVIRFSLLFQFIMCPISQSGVITMTCANTELQNESMKKTSLILNSCNNYKLNHIILSQKCYIIDIKILRLSRIIGFLKTKIPFSVMLLKQTRRFAHGVRNV